MNVPGVCRCGARWTGERIAHCGACHLTFVSVVGFDEHRDRQRNRCRTPDEIRRRGMEQNHRGYWRRPMNDSTASQFRRGK